jgi:glycosyltransferase involved in cell wall biosynthesis
MNDNLISVIIPFFNSANYLSDCISSVLRQTIHSYEIILVDNNSSDGSEQIAQVFANNYENIRYFFASEKQSHAYALNFGMKKIQGDFFCFLDSDDSIDDDYLEILLDGFRLFPEANISNISYKKENIYSSTYIKERRDFNFKFYDTKEDSLFLLMDGSIQVMMWGKLYKSHKFKDFYLDESYHASDTPNTYRLFELACNVVINSSKKYRYYYHEDSDSNYSKNFKHYLENIDIVYNTIKYVYDQKFTKRKLMIKKQSKLMLINILKIRAEIENSKEHQIYIGKVNEVLLSTLNIVGKDKKYLLSEFEKISLLKINNVDNEFILDNVYPVSKEAILYKFSMIWMVGVGH